jgi:hypothetical protein
MRNPLCRKAHGGRSKGCGQAGSAAALGAGFPKRRFRFKARLRAKWLPNLSYMIPDSGRLRADILTLSFTASDMF